MKNLIEKAQSLMRNLKKIKKAKMRINLEWPDEARTCYRARPSWENNENGKILTPDISYSLDKEELTLCAEINYIDVDYYRTKQDLRHFRTGINFFPLDYATRCTEVEFESSSLIFYRTDFSDKYVWETTQKFCFSKFNSKELYRWRSAWNGKSSAPDLITIEVAKLKITKVLDRMNILANNVLKNNYKYC